MNISWRVMKKIYEVTGVATRLRDMAELPFLWRYLPLLHHQAGMSPLEELLGCNTYTILTQNAVTDLPQ